MEKISTLLEVPLYVFEAIGTIWKTLACGLPINAVAFGIFCKEFVTKFNNDDRIKFYEFSPTLHKVLEHGQECIEFFPFPIGWMSEGLFE